MATFYFLFVCFTCLFMFVQVRGFVLEQTNKTFVNDNAQIPVLSCKVNSSTCNDMFPGSFCDSNSSTCACRTQYVFSGSKCTASSINDVIPGSRSSCPNSLCDYLIWSLVSLLLFGTAATPVKGASLVQRILRVLILFLRLASRTNSNIDPDQELEEKVAKENKPHLKQHFTV